ncbi:MAG: type 4a pilus biogenesis protein PilO [Candidatus Omnitrophota bacterium]
MIDIRALTPAKIRELFKDDVFRMYGILGAAVVMGLIYLGVVISPEFSKLAASSREVRLLNDKIEAVGARVKRLDARTKELNTLKRELSGYSKAFPDQKGIPEFLEELSAIASDSGVKILSITPEDLKAVAIEGENSGYYKEMPIIITAKSGYHQLGNFVSNLERGKRFIAIDDLDINYDNKFPRRHNIRMVLKTYVAVDEGKMSGYGKK